MDAKLLRWLGEDWPAPVVQRVVPIASPAAGADWSVTVPGESTWALASVSATLVTSAVAGARAPIFTVTDGSSVLWRVAPGTTQATALTVTYSWLPEMGAPDTTITGGQLQVALPPTYLQPGNVFRVATALLDVGDQWSAIVVQAYEVFNGHVERERGLADSIRDEAEAIAGIVEGTL
jgi:hypothetical protein